jgi:hypothetical protein
MMEEPTPGAAACVASKHQLAGKREIDGEIPLTVQGEHRSIQAGTRDRWCTMRDEFASRSFLAVTIAGVVLLCSGLVAFAFN